MSRERVAEAIDVKEKRVGEYERADVAGIDPPRVPFLAKLFGRTTEEFIREFGASNGAASPPAKSPVITTADDEIDLTPLSAEDLAKLAAKHEGEAKRIRGELRKRKGK